jgi:hypothetical protein
MIRKPPFMCRRMLRDAVEAFAFLVLFLAISGWNP